MKAVVQRVNNASVDVSKVKHAQIDNGLLILLGVASGDDEQDALWLSNKINQMRIFADENGKMNKSITDIGGQILLISQFTLLASTKKGNRPSFINAAKPEIAEKLYLKMAELLQLQVDVKTGVFGADMQIHSVNNGPVTILLDSRNKE